MVINWNFKWLVAFAQEFDHKFKIKVEAIALEGESVKTIAPEDFVHGKGILQVLAI